MHPPSSSSFPHHRLPSRFGLTWCLPARWTLVFNVYCSLTLVSVTCAIWAWPVTLEVGLRTIPSMVSSFRYLSSNQVLSSPDPLSYCNRLIGVLKFFLFVSYSLPPSLILIVLIILTRWLGVSQKRWTLVFNMYRSPTLIPCLWIPWLYQYLLYHPLGGLNFFVFSSTA